MFRDQLTEDRIRDLNRLHREMKIHLPEYKDALGKVDGAFALELLKEAPFPSDLKLQFPMRRTYWRYPGLAKTSCRIQSRKWVTGAGLTMPPRSRS